MSLCKNISYLCNIIYQKIFEDNNLNSENNIENNIENIKKNDVKINKIIIKSRHHFDSDYDYDNYLIENDLMCVICLNPLLNNVQELPCKHRYHINCLNKWKTYNDKCPICKTIII